LDTWIRVGVWSVLGFAIYFLYGIHNSALRKAEHIIASEKVVVENIPSESDPLVKPRVELENQS